MAWPTGVTNPTTNQSKKAENVFVTDDRPYRRPKRILIATYCLPINISTLLYISYSLNDKMVNLSEDGNSTTAEQLICSTGFFGIYLKIFISALNIPLSVAAFLGNSLIIVAIKKASSLRPPSKLFYICLAATDLCVGIFTQPLVATYYLSPEHSKLCFFLLYLIAAVGAIFCGVSLLTLTAISVDRLFALMMGIRYRQVVTLRRARILVAAFWLLCILISFIVSYKPRIAASMAIMVVILCIVISTFCYSKIFLTLHHRQTQVQGHGNPGQTHGGGIPMNLARYKKTVSSALSLQMALLACYLPISIIGALEYFAELDMQSLSFPGAVAITFLLLNSSINPFLYYWKMREERQAVKATIRRLFCFSQT